MEKDNLDLILTNLNKLYPNPKCALDYTNIYELLIAVVLSAQTTDASVNKVTPLLFKKYPTINDLNDASLEDIESIIKVLGLYKNKARSLKGLAEMIVNDFNSIVPDNYDDLIKLPGVGRKVANVMLVEGFKIPAMPVDTHINRVTKRFGFVSEEKDVLDVEKFWTSNVEPKYYHLLHHQLINFGRNICSAKNPKCDECFYKEHCKLK